MTRSVQCTELLKKHRRITTPTEFEIERVLEIELTRQCTKRMRYREIWNGEKLNLGQNWVENDIIFDALTGFSSKFWFFFFGAAISISILFSIESCLEWWARACALNANSNCSQCLSWRGIAADEMENVNFKWKKNWAKSHNREIESAHYTRVIQFADEYVR